MARQNIQFKGLRHSPSDITGQDGDLLECVNLIHENGEMKPIEMPERTVMSGEHNKYTGVSGILVAVHNLTDGKKFVFAHYASPDSTIWVKRDGDNGTVIFDKMIAGEEVLWAETIGNTLIIGTDKSTHYALYKNGAYKWLGDKLPQPVFEFDFTRENTQEIGYYINEFEPNTYALDGNGDPISGGGIPLRNLVRENVEESHAFLTNSSEENRRIIRDSVIGKVTRAIHKAKNANMFIFPFLVRYAVRMYDGNYAMHSAPILMLPSTLKCPLLAFLRASTKQSGNTYYTQLETYNDGHQDIPYVRTNDAVWFRAMEMKLKFAGFDVGDIEDWGDIVKGVDIFLSSEINTFDERAWDNLLFFPDSFKCFNGKINQGGGFIPDLSLQDYGSLYSCNKRLQWWDVFTGNNVEPFDHDLLIKIMNTGGGFIDGDWYQNYSIQLPSVNSNTTFEKIANTNLFHRVKKYDLVELSEAWSGYKNFSSEVGEHGLLERLETLPTLPDDYVSRSRMTGSVNYNYNQRLVLGNIKLQSPLWYQDAKRFKADVFYFDLYFIVEKPEKTIVVRWNSNDGNHYNDIGLFDFGHYIYYPDPDCKRVVIESGNNRKVLPMHEHTGLHGAYALMPDLQSLNEVLSGLDDWTGGNLPIPSQDRYYQMPNTIAMSSVANPFHFPATNFKDIGRTKVVGIAANTLDVSSGQWGQYPLYVFCSDGIIAIIIDGEGKFGGIQAVSADVLREPRGLSQPTLVQTGQALMFLTQRGAMAIAGTQINCLSDAMNGRHFNAMRELDDVNYHAGGFASLVGMTSDDTAFRDFAASGFLAYDYAHNRVLLLHPEINYQYVYGMDTGLWSKESICGNLPSLQFPSIPGNGYQQILPWETVTVHAAVNNYTELYLQDIDSWLYKTMEVQGENSVKQIYQYGYLVSRPIRFGTDEYKTLVRVLHRYTHYASNSFVKMALYGSRDGVKYGRINTLRGMSYQYFIFVVYTYLKPNERYSYMSVDFETRLTNKLR